MFSADDGKVIMKAEYNDGVPHGTFSVYDQGKVVKEGICKDGCIKFHARRRHGKLAEYGYIKNKQLHGRGVVIDDNGTVFRSPHMHVLVGSIRSVYIHLKIFSDTSLNSFLCRKLYDLKITLP